MMILSVWSWLAPVIAGVAGLLIGFLVGFLVARKVFENYMKKNPPINEKMIRTMMQQMGRTPSEKQVRQIMASMNQEK